MKPIKLFHVILVVLFAVTAFISTQYDLYTIERAVWGTVAYTVILIAGTILVFKPRYLINDQSGRGHSKMLGILFLVLSAFRVSSFWLF
ncbi:hypothetical protein [Natranaerofaba carboxydovora]|uniref:hypothetical protein n=1 Tax=Natranaerofaba carboxydovora TaxID=2742683 RepID=UPI001F12A73D|nr:hypothetical protein [Natranaerofaba carboxydovora]UMZ72981.1 hypothetical protein ACONDI_00523 [Natranaerofaba carboxydovora]